MKYVARAGVAVILIFIVLVGLVYLMPGDVVTSKYRSLDEARSDQLFGRGWLPDILPPSAHSIRVSNNLNLNTSDGSFSFNASDFPMFATKLRPYTPVVSPFVAYDQHIEKMKRKGFQSFVYEEDKTVWVFFCKQRIAYCEYDMWLRRG